MLTFFAIKAVFKFAFGTIMESSTGYNWHLNFVCNKIQTIMFWFEKSYNLLSKTFCKLTKWKFGNLVSWVFSFDKIEVWILLIRFVFLIAMCWSVFWKTIGLRSKTDQSCLVYCQKQHRNHNSCRMMRKSINQVNIRNYEKTPLITSSRTSNI